MDDPLVLKQTVLRILGQEALRLTPRDLSRRIRGQMPGAGHRLINDCIRQLVAAGELIYTQSCGTTHVQMAGAGLVQLDRAGGLGPGSTGPGPTPMEKGPVIRLVPGLSFGAGDHPTTCLVLAALAAVVSKISAQKPLDQAVALDIGTGSGVLAIGAALLGVGWTLGLDIDAAACTEAQANVTANNVSEKVTLVVGTLDAVGHGPYDLVLANLRPPTLVEIMPRMAHLLAENGWWILSGFRPDEINGVVEKFPKKMALRGNTLNRGWAAVTVQQM